MTTKILKRVVCWRRLVSHLLNKLPRSTVDVASPFRCRRAPLMLLQPLKSVAAARLPFLDMEGNKWSSPALRCVKTLPASIHSAPSPSVPHPSISCQSFPIAMKLISGLFPPSYQGVGQWGRGRWGGIPPVFIFRYCRYDIVGFNEVRSRAGRLLCPCRPELGCCS